jgi:hypothetical protein
MEDELFTYFSIPEFHEIQINDKLKISTEILYETGREIFKGVLRNFLRDEKLKKSFRSKSIFTLFLRSISEQDKSFKNLKQAKEKWETLDADTKESFRGKELSIKNKPKIKPRKKPRLPRTSFSIYVSIKCFDSFSGYEKLGIKWKSIPEEKKVPYKQIADYDRQRAEFEKEVFNRLEIIIRLLAASDPNKFIKKYNGFMVFKEEFKASLIERGFSRLPKFQLHAKKKYSRMPEDKKTEYKKLAKTKNEEMVERVFLKVISKSNVHFGTKLGIEKPIENQNLFDEDYDGFIFPEDMNYTL